MRSSTVLCIRTPPPLVYCFRLHYTYFATYATYAGIYFPTNKALTDKLRSFLKDERTILEPHNQEIAIQAVSKYDKVSNRGAPKRVYVKENKVQWKSGNLCMHVEMESGEEITVSYVKVARAVGSPEKTAERRKIDNMNHRLRIAVRHDIKDFKDEAMRKDCFCELCGKKLISRSESHVDHHGDNNEFRHIVEKYTNNSAGGDILSIDPDKFALFHKRTMTLRMLCAKCNISQPRK